jgi:hypothetical protein
MALDANEWSASRSTRLTPLPPWKSPRCLLNRTLVEVVRKFWRREISLAPFRNRTQDQQVCNLVTMLTELSRLLLLLFCIYMLLESLNLAASNG